MQSASSRIWTRVAVSISFDYNHGTTGISYFVVVAIEKGAFVSPSTKVSKFIFFTS